MAINKVVYGAQTLIDITDTTATADKVADGEVFYGANGVRTLGTASSGGGGIIPDGYELQSVSMGYTFGGFDGVRIPLVETKSVGATGTVTGSVSTGIGASVSNSSNGLSVSARVTNNNNANAYRCTASASFNRSVTLYTTQNVWLGTDYEELKQKTSGTIIVWLEPIS